MKKLIVITGHPGSGKTSIAKALSARYSVPFLSKDSLKECVFDTLGASDKEWSLKVSATAHRIMDKIIENHLSIGNSIIVESNFKPEIDSARFTKLTERYHAECLQLLCIADPEVLYERWVERIKASERHVGHVENISLDEIRQNFKEEFPSLNLPGDLIKLDTTHFEDIEDSLESLPIH